MQSFFTPRSLPPDAGAYSPLPLFSRLHETSRDSPFFFSLVRPFHPSTHLFVKPPLFSQTTSLSPTPFVVMSLHSLFVSFSLVSPFASLYRMHYDIRVPFYWQRQLPLHSIEDFYLRVANHSLFFFGFGPYPWLFCTKANELHKQIRTIFQVKLYLCNNWLKNNI